MLDIHDVSYRRNPYPTFQVLRNEKKLLRTKPFDYWLVSNYSDVRMLLTKPELFRSSGIIDAPVHYGPEFLLETRGLVGYDKPHHTQLRRHFYPHFKRAVMQDYEPTIRFICKTLLRTIKQRKSADIIDDFAKPLPLLVMANLLGIGEKYTELKQWAELLLTWRNLGKTAEVLSKATQMFDHLNMLIETRRRRPQQDLISKFITTQSHVKTITNEELLAMLRLLIFAGTEPVTNLIGNGLLALCNDTELQEQLYENPILIDNFIEEILRYNSPVLCLSRRINNDIELKNTIIKAGEIVLALLGSANHDEAIFKSADTFDIHRDSRCHMAFGAGSHYCLGAHLARLQARVAFEELFRAFKQFEIQNHSEPDYLDAFFFRGVRNLWLRIEGK